MNGRSIACLAYKSVMLVITLATLVGTVVLYMTSPEGFFPPEDTGFISGSTEANSDIAFPAMVELQKQVAEIVREDPRGGNDQFDRRRERAECHRQLGPPVHQAETAAERSEISTEVIAATAASQPGVPGMQGDVPNVKNLNIIGGGPARRIPIYAAVQ